jgi:hypothetical protein
MANRDDLLQQYIAKLEAGVPLVELLEHIPEEEASLRDLLRLTSAIRAVPWPEPARSPIQDSKVDSFIREHARAQKRQSPVQKRPFFPDWRGWAVPRLALSGLAVVALVILAIAWFASLNTQIHPVAALTLMEASGQIEFSPQDGAAWQPIRAGTPLAAGQRLRTGPGSTARLEFTDGSQLHLAANSEVAIALLAQRPDEALVVELRQDTGQTRHQVNPLRSANASYVVHTPSGEAEVRGTLFSVAVASDGRAFFAVDEGQVMVTVDGTAVPLAAGHAIGIEVGQAPPSPLRYFRSQGELLLRDRSLWQVDELLVYVTEETVLTGEFALGDWVEITGRILPNGRWQVDSVELAATLTHQSAFSGVLQAMTPRLWLVDGISVEVTEETERPSDLAVGDLVRVMYTRTADGQRLARQIEWLAPAQTETPEASVSPIWPTPSIEPDESEITPTPSVTAGPTNTPPTSGSTPTPSPTPPSADCTGVTSHPEALRLSQVYGVPYPEIIGWFCAGFGFGEVDLAYGLSRDSETAVAEIFEMRRQGLGWGEIMQLLGVRPGPPSGPPPPEPPTPGVTVTAVPTNPVNTATPVNPSPTDPPATPFATEEPGPPITLPVPSLTPPTSPGPPSWVPTATP